MNWNLNTPEKVLSITREAISKAEKAIADLLVISDPTFHSTLRQLALIEAELQVTCAAPAFLFNVSTNRDIRAASSEASMLLQSFKMCKEMNEGLFKLAIRVLDEEGHTLGGEDWRYLERGILAARRNGLDLPVEKRQILKAKRERIAGLCNAFCQNLNEDETFVEFSLDELAGCQQDWLDSLARTPDNKLKVTTSYPDVAAVLQYANTESIRKRMDEAFSRRCPDNRAIIEECIKLRAECAHLLGYTSHAEFMLDKQMAKTVQAVETFHKEIHGKLRDVAAKELQRMKQAKLNDTGSSEFHTWDMAFYARRIEEAEYAVDHGLIKEYFSLDTVTEEMLKVYEEVLGLKFEHLKDAQSWHSDVKVIKVYNASDNNPLGELHLDMYPREGKFSHACCLSLLPGYENADGSRALPTPTILANFSKPTPGKPSLLKHSEVVTFFHELGHAMHEMCSKTVYSRFHGMNGEIDFMEAPSQMLENWCWDKETLKRLSKHYKTGESLSDELIAALCKTKNFNVGLQCMRMIFLGTFDLTIHGLGPDLTLPNSESIDQLYARLRFEYTGIEQPADVWPAASFGHMLDNIDGYDAGYYGYLWSEVFSADMFYSRFLKEGLGNPKTGLEYRRSVLEKGSSRDSMTSLEDFLGRPPTADAFYLSIKSM